MAEPGAECGCTNISIMQLFHELKQEFPAVPDEVVTQCIRQNAHNKGACERALRQELQAHMVHTYPTALMTGTRRMSADPTLTSAPCGKTACAPSVPLAGSGNINSNKCSEHCGEQYPKSGSGLCSDGVTKIQCSGDRCCDNREHRPVTSGTPLNPPQDQYLPPIVSDLNLHISKPSNDPVNQSGIVNTSPAHYPQFPPRLDPPPLGPQNNNPFLSEISPVSGGDHQNGVVSNFNNSAFPSDDVTVLDVNCSVSQHIPRHTAAMQLQPMPHFSSSGPPRSYTSVNLTLRPPSSQPQPPIDIHSGGSSLTYSTSSYDPRQGYQSQLQIRIGPGGLGSVSAVRTRAPVSQPPPAYPAPMTGHALLNRLAPIMTDAPQKPVGLRNCHTLLEEEEPETEGPTATREQLETLIAMGHGQLGHHTEERLFRQLERRALLETELRKERNKLRAMQREVADMEKDLKRRTDQARPRPPALPVMEKVQRLRAEIQELQEECTRMTHEVDAKTPDSLPLGETDEEFYKNIYTGPSGSLWPRVPQYPQPAVSRPVNNDVCNEPGWTCQICTFHNHPLLEACETCDVPRIPQVEAATQDIHIRVTHHNFPLRRSLHGWVD